MFKDRKFWTGAGMGVILGATMMLTAPTNAAKSDNSGALLNAIGKTIASMSKKQNSSADDIAAIRRNSDVMVQSLKALEKSQGLSK